MQHRTTPMQEETHNQTLHPEQDHRRLIALDLETTGLSVVTDRVIEIGMLEIENRSLTGKTLEIRMNPQIPIPAGSSAIHGIFDHDIAHLPSLSDQLDDIFGFIGNAAFIIHNADYDRSLLLNELKRYDSNYLEAFAKADYYDTLTMARKKYPQQRNDLSSVCARLHIPTPERDETGIHNALADARLTALAFLAITKSAESIAMNFQESTATHNNPDAQNASQKISDNTTMVVLNQDHINAHTAHRDSLRKRYETDSLPLDHHLPINSPSLSLKKPDKKPDKKLDKKAET